MLAVSRDRLTISLSLSSPRKFHLRYQLGDVTLPGDTRPRLDQWEREPGAVAQWEAARPEPRESPGDVGGGEWAMIWGQCHRNRGEHNTQTHSVMWDKSEQVNGSRVSQIISHMSLLVS